MIILYDFEDSFTHNILEYLSPLKDKFGEVELRLWHQLNDSDFSEKNLIVLGPGPGNTSEYSAIDEYLNQMLFTSKVSFMGICLGHQLIWSRLGQTTLRHQLPLHGVAQKITLPSWPIFKGVNNREVEVQHYNSLFVSSQKLSSYQHPLQVQNFAKDDQLMMSWFPTRGITYQFHPESIGTSCPEIFFNPKIFDLR